MKLSTLFTINAIVSVLFGISFVLAPEFALSFFGVSLSPAGILIARLFGTALLGFAVLTWFARNAGDSEARQAIVMGIFVSEAAAFIVALLGQLGGVLNALGWSAVAIHLLLALGYGYFQFLKPSNS